MRKLIFGIALGLSLFGGNVSAADQYGKLVHHGGQYNMRGFYFYEDDPLADRAYEVAQRKHPSWHLTFEVHDDNAAYVGAYKGHKLYAIKVIGSGPRRQIVAIKLYK